MFYRAISPFTFARRTLNHALQPTKRLSSDIRLDGAQLTIPDWTHFSYQWLRDSCQCPSCVHPSTSQKLHRSSDVPADVRPLPDGLKAMPDGVHIRWTDGHESFYGNTFLKHHSSPSELTKFHRDAEQIHWDASSISHAKDLYIPYKELAQPSCLLGAISQLTQYGLLFVTGVPNEQASDDTCELRKLSNMFGELRTTFYGDVWDVKNVPNSRNIAYTNLDLGLHMDLLYFQHPPRYQILHCLRNRVIGGTSIFVDAFRVASLLRESHPADFDVLATTHVPFHYINDGHHLHYEHPTIELGTTAFGTASNAQLPIKYINYSPPFQAPLLASAPESFYTALGKFASLLDDTNYHMKYTLNEGDAVIFDNRRVLHARTGFTDGAIDGTNGCEGETNRWLKGCYLEADAILDRGRILRARLDRND